MMFGITILLNARRQTSIAFGLALFISLVMDFPANATPALSFYNIEANDNSMPDDKRAAALISSSADIDDTAGLMDRQFSEFIKQILN
jgi:hypothetical protein